MKKASRKRSASVAKSASQDDGSITALVERNYASLRTIARREITQRKLQRTMTPTSLVAETVMRLMRQRKAPESNSQLCGLATIMMTRAIADRSRRARARKRGSARKAIGLDDSIERDHRKEGAKSAASPLVLQRRVLSCLSQIAKDHPREMEVVTLHLLLGIPVEKAGKLMGISRRTAYRCLADGLAHLRAEVGLDGAGLHE